uniref:Zinc finger PHD-type domain-containing protein n=1 Tax=Octopus bimaculoides TaxID=37653 RepID=A0A0L8FSV5_OCTBM
MCHQHGSQSGSTGCPWELLYTFDLDLIAESLPELEKTILELKGLRINLAKTKVLVSMTTEIPTEKWHCLICRKRLGRNSIRYTWCKLWTHKRCSSIRGRLTEKVVFVCGRCAGTINSRNFQISNCGGNLKK